MELNEFLEINFSTYGYENTKKIKKFWFCNNNYEHFLNEIYEKTKFLDEKCSLSERIYYLKNKITTVKCEFCNNKLKFRNFRDGYQKTCGNLNCVNKNWNKIESNGKSKAINTFDKALNTMRNDIDENGNDACKRAGLKSSITKKTKICSNGLSILQNAANKAKDTMKKIGVDGLSKYQQIAKKAIKTLKNEITETGESKFDLRVRKCSQTKLNNIIDGLNTNQRGALKSAKKMKTTILSNGLSIYENSFSKRKSKITSWKSKTRKYNDDIHFQGKNEKNFLDMMSELNLISKIKNGNTIKYIDDKGEHKNYYPDFMILPNTIIEVKSRWTYDCNGNDIEKRINNNLKWKSVLNKSFNFFVTDGKMYKKLSENDLNDKTVNIFNKETFLPISCEFQITGE